MITIIGTSHIAQQSIDKIKKQFLEKNIDCVAVELDSDRLHCLKNRDKNKPKSYFDKSNIIQSIIIKLLMRLQNKLSKETGLQTGQEMLFAVQQAEKRNIEIKLIDQHITTTIAKLNKISYLEKIKFFFYIVFGIFGLPFVYFKSVMSFDLNKIPDKNHVEQIMIMFKKNFPQTFEILVCQRNEIMAEKIKNLAKTYENILVIVGVGHIKGLKQILKTKISV